MSDYKLIFSETMRDSIHNLDLNKPANREIFRNYTREYIVLMEGISDKAYIDTKGKVTVGVGFNMDRKEGGASRKEWEEVFRGEVSFDEVYNGNRKLTKEEIYKLLDYSIDTRVKEIKNIYGKDWEELRPNERITIISLYFNNPALVKQGTKFYDYIHNYINASDKSFLLAAVYEVEERSNRANDPGIANRRRGEGGLLRPSDSTLLPDDRIEIVLGKTVVPLDMERGSAATIADNSGYYIWRTRMDHKVRLEHLKKEGRVFRKDEGKLPEQGYNCRCWAEAVTQNIKIIDHTYGNFKSFEQFIRYGGGATIVIST